MRRYVTYVDPNDCDPPHGLDLSSAHDADKVAYLVDCFSHEGFNEDCPALVGYPLNGRIQLFSGTHRHYAAVRTNTRLPVTLWLRSYVEHTWGTDKWPKLITDLSVKTLKEYERSGDLLDGELLSLGSAFAMPDGYRSEEPKP